MKDQRDEKMFAYVDWLTRFGGAAKEMTLRDFYAGLAMHSDLGANGWGGDIEHTVQQAWAVADAMLRTRGDK